MTPIVSIQTFVLTIEKNNSSKTQAINTVDKSRSIVFYNGISSTASSVAANDGHGYVELVDDNTLRAVRQGNSATFTTSLYATVVQFSPDVVDSVQHGLVTILAGANSGTATISAVTEAQSIVNFQGYSHSDATFAANYQYAGVRLTNPSTVTANRQGTTGEIVLSFGVIQWNAAAISSIQKGICQFTASTSMTQTATISAVDTQRSMLFCGGFVTNQNTSFNAFLRGEITDPTTVTYSRGGSSSLTSPAYFSVVELVPGIIASIQRGLVTIASSAASGSAALSPAPASAYTILNFNGWLRGTSTISNSPQISFLGLALNDNDADGDFDQVDAFHGATAAVVASAGYEVVTFVAPEPEPPAPEEPATTGGGYAPIRSRKWPVRIGEETRYFGSKQQADQFESYYKDLLAKPEEPAPTPDINLGELAPNLVSYEPITLPAVKKSRRAKTKLPLIEPVKQSQRSNQDEELALILTLSTIL